MQTLIAVMGVLVTVMVVAGMVLMTPRNLEGNPKIKRTYAAADDDVAVAPPRGR